MLAYTAFKLLEQIFIYIYCLIFLQFSFLIPNILSLICFHEGFPGKSENVCMNFYEHQ